MRDYQNPVNPAPLPLAPTPHLSARELVHVVCALEARRVDCWRAGHPTTEVDRQLHRARLMLRHREYAVPPAGVR